VIGWLCLGATSASAARLVDPIEARRLVDDGATVLDTRSTWSFLTGHLPGAVSVGWRIGVVGGLRSGILGDPADVARAYAAVGVQNDRPVLVVGAWTGGWGEEGRVAWDLAYLGHPDVNVLVGGDGAWTGPWSYGPSRPEAGDFTATVREALRADRDDVRAGHALVIDVREPDEFDGSNRYLAAYGGHVPGAVSVPWRTLLDGTAAPLPVDRPLVVYCTGGVRSAMAWLWLTNHGHTVANYDGSWWDWAAAEPRP
jgi:thiosulfate/3-mercaptopyruvate sulfurtransferase